VSLDWVVYWLAMVSCVAFLANLAASRFAQGFAWTVKCVLVLAVSGIAYRQQSAALQALTGGLWALLIAVPTVLGRLSGRSALRFRYDRALRYMQLAWLLHPFNGWRFNRQILFALAFAQRGELERAKAKLAALSDDPRTLARERPVIPRPSLPPQR
jgi:hypothetical protein